MRLICRLLLILASAIVLSSCAAALVGGGAAGGYYLAKDKGTAGRYTDDSVITSKIKSQFLADSDIKSFHISVNTTDRVVTLSGKVSTVAMKERAIHVAAHTKGVRQVIANNLRVSS